MSLEFNKAAAAVLTAGITFMVAGFIGDRVVHPHRLANAAIATGEAPVAQAAAPVAELPDIGPLLASADVDAGKQVAQRLCSSCHTFDQGGANRVGPNLYNVVGGPHGHAQGFNYSSAMAGQHDKAWDYAALNHFLNKPSAAIPGTRMAFAGISNTQQRANVIAYLRSLAAEPKPLP